MLKYISKIPVFVGLLSAVLSAALSVLLFTANPALAGRVANLYDAEILVADESVATRERAFTQGLDEVFVRISGDSSVMKKLKRPPSSRYVKQFSYSPIENPEVNDKDELLTHRLNILYNGRAMEKYLLDNGLPAWGEYRTDVVVWLVVRDGKNEYVLKDVDQSELKTSVVDAMARRGVPDVWPAYDKKDKKILSVSEIRGGFKEPVMKASQRYSRGPALAGSMIWNGKQWQSSWNLLLNDENLNSESRHWRLNDTDHDRLITQAIDQAADALGAVYAVHTLNNEEHTSVWLDLQAVKTIEDYRYVENYLAGLNAVEKVKPAKVDGETVVFEVLLRSTEEEFLNSIKHDAELTKVEPPVVEPTIVDTPDSKTQGSKMPGAAQTEAGSQGKPQSVATTITPLLKTGASESSAPAVSTSTAPTSTVPAGQKDAQATDVTGAVVGGAAGQVSPDQSQNAVITEQAEPDLPEPKQTYYYRLNRSH